MENDKNAYESDRSKKIAELGCLCYNIAIDNGNLPGPITDSLSDMKDNINKINAMREQNADADIIERYNKELEQAAINTGCVCYNLYIDNCINEGSILGICNEISRLNKLIYDDHTDQSINDRSVGSPELKNSGIGTLENANRSYNGETDAGFNVIYPYGMEPIPDNFILCRCGYRNKSFAVYCGKCGIKLKV